MPLVRIRDLFLDEFETYVTGTVPRNAVIRNGDVVIGMDGDFNLAVWKRGEAALNQRLCALRPRADVDIRFIAYALPDALHVINDLAYSTTVKHLSSLEVTGERLLLPPVEEQRRIADFLDAETDRIDRMAESRERQLAGLSERQKSAFGELFSGCSSGTAVRLKHLLAMRPRYGVLVPEFADEGVPFIRVNDLLDLSGRSSNLIRIPHSLSAAYSRTQTFPGDVLVSVVGTVGRAAIVPKTLSGANVARAVALLRPQKGVSASLLVAWLGTADFEHQALLATGTDTAQPTLGMEDLSNFAVRWPSDEHEQQRLAVAVDEVVRWTNDVRKAISRQLALLAERRQALITAAVTGQIDVTTAHGADLS